MGKGAAGPCSRVHGRLGRVRRQLAGKEPCFDNLKVTGLAFIFLQVRKGARFDSLQVRGLALTTCRQGRGLALHPGTKFREEP